MPMPGFISSLTEKAQQYAEKTPLASRIPGTSAHAAAQDQPSANQAAAQGASPTRTTNPALEAIQYHLRQFGQQYSSTSPVQRVITTSKGVSIDFDSLGRDAKAQSKELYTWGQSEAEDIKDVTDRLAFINFVHGSLAGTVAQKLDASRSTMKELRDAEAQLAPRRTMRAGLETQIGRIEHNQEKGMERKLAELREQLNAAVNEDADIERTIILCKRKGVRESEQAKWDALREYGEKLVLLSQAASSVIGALPTTPPTQSSPYTGTAVTAGARASLQRALDNYKTGHISLPSHKDSLDSHAGSTASFGETHSAELSAIHPGDATHTALPTLPLTPPPTHPALGSERPLHAPSSWDSAAHTQTHPVSAPLGIPGAHATSPAAGSTPPAINPALLNQTPAPLPASPEGGATPAAAGAHVGSPTADVHSSPANVPSVTPTLAETGVPVVSGAGGPGPASGSLKDLRKDSNPFNDAAAAGAASAAAAPPKPQYETADEEKQRLQREERERLFRSGAPIPSAAASTPQYETADDEKKRLEREERERLLAGSSGAAPRRDTGEDKGDELPPYQEPTLQ